ncbi:hypothetical protein Sros_4514 [Streptosporangium roseum DSM 43021]|uniref:Uncharacterized protein n=1 Tax=Streptosporangium roseum (strain ATCC 12428 / DSM 43021 / JCM 3005 / KCTC 9067 / NCIMB 10171 / NRRL 2505 / NI 9100) TaxID=479432 RepID=D2B1S7_STRRD|nr:hypothetical protein Sros_4514 [Streptosporangium roseum DSM 43021]
MRSGTRESERHEGAPGRGVRSDGENWGFAPPLSATAHLVCFRHEHTLAAASGEASSDFRSGYSPDATPGPGLTLGVGYSCTTPLGVVRSRSPSAPQPARQAGGRPPGRVIFPGTARPAGTVSGHQIAPAAAVPRRPSGLPSRDTGAGRSGCCSGCRCSSTTGRRGCSSFFVGLGDAGVAVAAALNEFAGRRGGCRQATGVRGDGDRTRRRCGCRRRRDDNRSQERRRTQSCRREDFPLRYGHDVSLPYPYMPGIRGDLRSCFGGAEHERSFP